MNTHLILLSREPFNFAEAFTLTVDIMDIKPACSELCAGVLTDNNFQFPQICWLSITLIKIKFVDI